MSWLAGTGHQDDEVADAVVEFVERAIALRVRDQASHAVNAVVMFVALACVVVSVLRQHSATGIT